MSQILNLSRHTSDEDAQDLTSLLIYHLVERCGGHVQFTDEEVRPIRKNLTTKMVEVQHGDDGPTPAKAGTLSASASLIPAAMLGGGGPPERFRFIARSVPARAEHPHEESQGVYSDDNLRGAGHSTILEWAWRKWYSRAA
jgi:hypothetical protein